MKQLRRLDVATPSDPYRRAQRCPLRSIFLSEADFHRLERERPECIIVDDQAVLIGQPFRQTIDLQYAFPDRDAFARQFPAMLERFLAAVSQAEAPLGLRLRLTDRTSRPYLEPVLFAQAFELNREWMEMALFELPAEHAPADDIAHGFVLRPARPDDAETIAELDAAVFPTPAFTPDVVRDLVAQAPVLRVLEEPSSGRAVGFLRLRLHAPGVGYISDIAVHPDYQRRGLGEAMMRWALAWFRQEGLRRAALMVNVENAPAIALYRKLGFVFGKMGFDYRRPIDEEEVRQVLEKHRVAHIRVRRRY